MGCNYMGILVHVSSAYSIPKMGKWKLCEKFFLLFSNRIYSCFWPKLFLDETLKYVHVTAL